HLAVGTGLERMRLDQCVLQFAVVVDLAVDREDELTVGGTDRLCAAGGVDDCQSLVDEDRAIVDVHTAPVRTAMTLPLRELQRLAPQLDKVVARGEAEDTEDRTHGGTSLKKKPALRSAGRGER